MARDASHTLLNMSQGCAAKLTGAGGGGCAFAVLDERKDAEAQRLLLVRLRRFFRCTNLFRFVSRLSLSLCRSNNWLRSFPSSAASSCELGARGCNGILNNERKFAHRASAARMQLFKANKRRILAFMQAT